MFILVLTEEILVHLPYLQADVLITMCRGNTVVVLFYFIKCAWNLNKITHFCVKIFKCFMFIEIIGKNLKWLKNFGGREVE